MKRWIFSWPYGNANENKRNHSIDFVLRYFPRETCRNKITEKWESSCDEVVNITILNLHFDVRDEGASFNSMFTLFFERDFRQISRLMLLRRLDISHFHSLLFIFVRTSPPFSGCHSISTSVEINVSGKLFNKFMTLFFSLNRNILLSFIATLIIIQWRLRRSELFLDVYFLLFPQKFSVFIVDGKEGLNKYRVSL